MIDNEKEVLTRERIKSTINDVDRGMKDDGFRLTLWTTISTLSIMLIILITSSINLMVQNEIVLVILQIGLPYLIWLFLRLYTIYFDIEKHIGKKQLSTCFVITGFAAIIIYYVYFHTLHFKYMIILISSIASFLVGVYISPIWFLEYGTDFAKIWSLIVEQFDCHKKVVLPSLITSIVSVWLCLINVSTFALVVLTIIFLLLLILYYSIKTKTEYTLPDEIVETTCIEKWEAVHHLYELCKSFNHEDSLQLIKKAGSQEEKEFISTISDFFIRQKQRKVIEEKKF